MNYNPNAGFTSGGDWGGGDPFADPNTNWGGWLGAILPKVGATPPYSGVNIPGLPPGTPGAPVGLPPSPRIPPAPAAPQSPFLQILSRLLPAIPGLIGSIIQSRAIGGAANAQVGAQNTAANLQYKASQDALAFLKEMFAQQQGNQAPWLTAGKQGLASLQTGLAPGGALATPFSETFTPTASLKPFTPPTATDMYADPGFQARLDEGTKAIQRAAAAKGGLLSGATLKALDRFSQDYASNEYSNVYNRAAQNYGLDVNANNTAYARALNEFGTRRDVMNQNQTNLFNRYASLAGLGQTAANQNTASAGTYGTNVAGLTIGQGANAANTATNIGNVTAASGLAGSNVWANFLNSLGQSMRGGVTLQDILNMSKGINATA